MKVLAIVGSPRPKGNTNYLVDLALEEMGRMGIETEKISLHNKKIAPCRGNDRCATFEKCEQQDDAPWIMDKYLEADAVILGTPVYYFMMSAQLKLFMDRNYFWRRHGKKMAARAVGAVVVSESAGEDDTVRTIQRYFKLVRGAPPDQVHVLIGHAKTLGQAQEKPDLAESARAFGRNLAQAMIEAPLPAQG